MITKCKRIGKRSLSVLLAVLIMISAMMLGSIATIEASAAISSLDIRGSKVGSANADWNDPQTLTYNSTGGVYYNNNVYIGEQAEFKIVINGSTYYGRADYSKRIVYADNMPVSLSRYQTGSDTNDSYNAIFGSPSGYYGVYVTVSGDVPTQVRFFNLESTNQWMGIASPSIYDSSAKQNSPQWSFTEGFKFTKSSDIDYILNVYMTTFTGSETDGMKLLFYRGTYNSPGMSWVGHYESGVTYPSLAADTEYLYDSGDCKNAGFSGAEGMYTLHYNPLTRKLKIVSAPTYDINTNSEIIEGAALNYYVNSTAVDKATADSTVTVTATPPADVAAVENAPNPDNNHSAIHYITDTVTVTDASGNEIDCNLTQTGINTFTFEMPAQEVTVSVTFKQNSFVTVETETATTTSYGSVSKTSGGSAKVGTEEEAAVEVRDSVTLTATAYTGYNFSGWSITGTYYTDNDITSDTSITIYPATDVVATANFTEDPGEVQSWYIFYRSTDNFSDTSPVTNKVHVYKKNSSHSKAINGEAYYADLDVTDMDNCYFDSSGTDQLWSMYYYSNSQTDNKSKFTISVEENSGIEYDKKHKECYNFIELRNLSNIKRLRVYIIDKNNDNEPDYDSFYVEVLERRTYGTAAEASTTVNLWAKRGTTRNGAEGRNDGTYSEYFASTNTTVTGISVEPGASDEADTRFHSTVNKYIATKGDTITITTTVRPTACNRVYVKAFVINGYAYGIINEPAAGSAQRKKDGTGGIYTCTYKIPENTIDTDLEITPVFFYFTDGSSDNKDNEYITFYAEDFEGTVKDDWGNTISCYAWYSDTSGDDKSDIKRGAIGGYPGQPMIYENGSYYMQVPKYLYTKTSGATDTETSTKSVIQGITMNNYYWDDVHFYKGNKGGLGTNCQTYDYDDFVALMQYNSLESIIFSFKYRTTKDNGGNGGSNGSSELSSDHTSSAMTWLYDSFGTNGNGWNAFVDYYDVSIDIFGNKRTKTEDDVTTYIKESEVEEQISNNNSIRDTTDENWTKFLYVISDGYSTAESPYIGYYATKWHIYDENGKHLADLPPSAFVFEIPEEYLTKDLDTSKPLDGFLGYSDKAKNYTKRTSELWAAYCSLYNAKDETTNKYLYRGLPVMITYEKAIADKGARYDYGNRNDGRWYFSRKGSKISADIMIQIVDDDDNILIEEDSLSGNTGSTTGASAYFTNTDFYKAVTSGEVKQSSAAYFTFEADGISTNGKKLTKSNGTYSATDETATYKFVGWYLRTGSGQLYPSINIGDDIANTSGRRAMISNATFVARYKEVEQSTEETVTVSVGGETVSVPNRTLIVNHNPLSTATAATVPTVHNGTGTTTVSSIVITYPDNSTKTFTGSATTLTLDPEDLYEASTVTVKLTSIPSDSSTSVYDLYNYESSSYYRSGEKEGNTEGEANTKNVDGHTESSYIYGDTGAKTVSYTYNISDLFTDGTKTKTLNFFSDFETTTVTVYLKYYDRKIERNKATNINTEENTLTLKINVGPEDKFNDKIQTEVVAKVGKYLKNELCEYVIWNSQSASELGIKAETNYRVIKADGNGNYLFGTRYATYEESNLTTPNWKFHTDCFGKLQSESGNIASDGVNWFTYKNAKGGTVGEPANDATGAGSISSVTIWAFNTPRKYYINAYAPKAGAELSTEYTLSDGTTIYGISSSDTSDNLYSEPQVGFYNQRVGVAEQNAGDKNDLIDASVDYLKSYNNVPGYLGTTIRATDNVKADGNKVVLKVDNEKGTKEVLVFDGWYAYEDVETTTVDGKKVTTPTALYKITADHLYGYRITTTLKIVAGYKKVSIPIESTDTSSVKSDVGISLTNNGTDYYALNGEKRVRLNTQLNVYGVADFNEDNRIQKVSVIYVQFPSTYKDSNNVVHNFTGKGDQKSIMDDLVARVKVDVENGVFEKTGMNRIVIEVKDLTVDQNSKIYDESTKAVEIGNGDKLATYIDYTYEVSDDDGSYKVQLTNKNRYQFVLNMNADDHDEGGKYSAVVAFGAMKYDFTEYVLDEDGNIKYTNGVPTIATEKTEDVKWLVSDNYVDFITNTKDQ